ncbi:hypothetical protein AUK11_03150 [bacterium CG2_30_37_16]|nr:MAG: hypothetical protein AUK11_03150 [bacterium CG2_30_37_16]PIP30225.1 MAG: hypothetical protein COX25_05740 [bacterium (Candidatus Howlettbacteria) CG23_combo_of_CG06-09_8_20_14_all_37_9]PIY00199.1 MAG: hypothetical protein COZ22_00865 [bacterium (Candidatus Howlettbacteria) CG_4_10_14_3_um_filter_37_10]PJB07245.1 MAG: hypothetical protein CO123_00625 [bacterium (Candidatus Howlettbacteria) CG_4_9_14_3_um_filter_37_10]
MNKTELVKKILAAHKIAVVSHKKPDGDAVSSLMALVLSLHKLNKEIIAYTKIDISSQFPFLPGVLFTKDKLDARNIDLVILLDHNVLVRGEFQEELSKRKLPMIIIDHHPLTVNPDGLLYYIDEKAAATTEILFEIIGLLGVKIDKQIATCLLTGLVTDTNSFQNQNTTLKTLKLASDLLNNGANLSKIINSTYKEKPLSDWKLMGRALKNLKYIKKYNMAYAFISNRDLEELNIDKEKASGISNYLILSLKEAKIVLTLIEEEAGVIKGSLRTRDASINLNKVAEIFGGGGHRGASGFVVSGKISHQTGEIKY